MPATRDSALELVVISVLHLSKAFLNLIFFTMIRRRLSSSLVRRQLFKLFQIHEEFAHHFFIRRWLRCCRVSSCQSWIAASSSVVDDAVGVVAAAAAALGNEVDTAGAEDEEDDE